MHDISKPLRCTLLASAMIAAFPLSSGIAWAQDQSAATNAAGATKGTSGKKGDETSATALPTVIVTAQKRTQDIRKVPSSISVVGSEKMENQHVASLVDLAGSLPGVQIDSSGSPGLTSIAIRGISSLGQGSVVGTYIDDSPLGSSSNFANGSLLELDLLPYDLDRIEVLRGPQGTLYGAGAMGGLVKYVLKEPDVDSTTGEVGGGISSISGGSGTGWDGRASVNLPLIQDKLGITASVSENRTPGYVDNAVTGQNGINAVTQKSGRLALLWEPNDDVKLKVSALHQSVNADDIGVIPLDPVTQQPIYGDQKTGTALPQPFRKQVNFYSATLNWNLQWADFTSATSYSTSAVDRAADLSVTFGPLFPLVGLPEGLSAFDGKYDLKKVTQEFRLASKPDDHFEWLVGTFFTHETSHNLQSETAQAMDGSSIAGLDPLYAASLPSTYKEAALFGDFTYKFTDSFDVTGGLRYARNEQTFEQKVTGGEGLIVPLGDNSGHSAQNVLTWMLSPEYHLNDDSMLYVRAATGYRPGGPNFAVPGVPPSVRSDTLINYEAGWKSLFFDKKASIDFDIYDINWRNIQVGATTPNGAISYVVNGGTATSRGAELSTALMPTQGLRLGLNAAYTDAYLTQDVPSLDGKNGDSLPGIPRFNWAFTTDYYFSLPNAWAGHVGGDYRWTGKRLSNVNSNPYTYREGSYGVLDLYADISRDIWKVQFYVKNLTNAHPHLNIGYLQNGATGAVADLQSYLLQPRTVGVEFDVQF
ncbi:TonB-dependent receptor [Rhodanobacter glycinis]|uniref:TonB-dependent receptor n=1 Tax=Rhodanobacter glycinis TaxID=582702 RepID=A0A5B9DZA5_9GAMM|nr:TonB-dependent receptor [Rhodanobacter glycinis]QEE24939.1 TonB-dependent receptor [Rhodanobacter glycinis]